MTQPMVVLTPFEDIADLTATFAERVDDERIMLPFAEPIDAGTVVEFQVVLADQSVALAGAGTVENSFDNGEEYPPEYRFDVVVTGLRFEGMNEVMFERFLAERDATAGAASTEADLAETGEGPYEAEGAYGQGEAEYALVEGDPSAADGANPYGEGEQHAPYGEPEQAGSYGAVAYDEGGEGYDAHAVSPASYERAGGYERVQFAQAESAEVDHAAVEVRYSEAQYVRAENVGTEGGAARALHDAEFGEPDPSDGEVGVATQIHSGFEDYAPIAEGGYEGAEDVSSDWDDEGAAVVQLSEFQSTGDAVVYAQRELVVPEFRDRAATPRGALPSLARGPIHGGALSRPSYDPGEWLSVSPRPIPSQTSGLFDYQSGLPAMIAPPRPAIDPSLRVAPTPRPTAAKVNASAVETVELSNDEQNW